jgi:hypothetical protein
MPQLFPSGTNTVLRTIVVAAVAFGAVVTFAVWAFARTPAATGQYRAYRQPVPFSHPLHVNGLKIDCRYCHAGAERTAMAGLPPTQACVPCHLDSLINTDLFAPIRASIKNGQPIPWQRVTSVPDFVYFNHAVHVRTGVRCESCHGPVNMMATVYQAAPLTMEWCLQCHRNPTPFLRNPDNVTKMGYQPQPGEGDDVQKRNSVHAPTNCSTCHR